MNRKYMTYNKFRNKTCHCNAGHIHDSRKEGEYCDQLGLLLKHGGINSYRTQISYDLKVNGQHICRHIVDFEVVNKNDQIEIHEVKGFATDVWKLKHKLFEAVYPDIKYYVIN